MSKAKAEPLYPNIVVSIKGEPKSGKTHLACTFPKPMRIYSFERGAKWIVQRKFPGENIDIKEYPMPIVDDNTTTVWALPIWEDFYAQYSKDAYSGEFQTLVLDTGTKLETILRQAILEDTQKAKPNKQKLAITEYGARNLRMGALYDTAFDAEVNLVLTHHLKDKWQKMPGTTDKFENTGERVFDGWGQAEGAADVILLMEERDLGGKSVMFCTVEKCRFERDLNRQKFQDTTYAELAELMLGDE